ncbi:DUF6350 family protein [Kitasatospora sp. NBC_01250]|uniref:cell division protein PerM n=1 Tax=Kitasatospora sp. NBC_01250 TaxID=2903571 RepID=UPI002E380E18|nr:DUF6350 family protein [Kitasatospora sp. NBC_01250]
MTQHLMGRRIPRGVGSPGSGPLLAGATAALLGLAVTGVPVLVLWVLTATGHDSAADAARLVGVLWLLGHGGPLTRGAGAPLSLTPLLLTLLNAQLLRCAAARAAVAAQPRTGPVPALLCTGYLLVALPVALACAAGGGGLRAEPLPDLLAVALLGYAAAQWGVHGGAGFVGPAPVGPGRLAAVRRRLPAGSPGAVRAAVTAGLLILLAGGALLFGMAALLRTDTTDPAVRALAGGSVPAALGVLLSCLLLVPNAVLWAGAYALGPGFLLGTDTVVAPGRVQHGALPDFPLLALAPTTASGWQLLVLLVPALAGAVAAGLLGRAAAWGGGRRAAVEPAYLVEAAEDDTDRAEPGQPWRAPGTALAGLATAAAAGALVALAGWLAGGAAGGGRMARLGPSFACGTVAAGWFAVLVLPGALVVRWWLLRRAAPAAAAWDESAWAGSAWAGPGPGLGGPGLHGSERGGPASGALVLAGPALDELELDGPELGGPDPRGDGPHGRRRLVPRSRAALAARWTALRLRPGRGRGERPE